jgi:hypothetical protein
MSLTHSPTRFDDTETPPGGDVADMWTELMETVEERRPILEGTGQTAAVYAAHLRDLGYLE